MRWAGLLLLIIGVVGAISAWNTKFSLSSDADVFHAIWNQDLEHLKTAKKLPLGWNSLRMVEYNALDKEVWQWIESRKPNIDINHNGEFKLEILIDVWDDEEGKAALVEYHLIDLKTENKIWELGRTFQLRGPTETKGDTPLKPEGESP